MFFSLPIVQKKGHMPLPLEGKIPTPSSSGHERIVNLKCLFLSLPIRMGERVQQELRGNDKGNNSPILPTQHIEEICPWPIFHNWITHLEGEEIFGSYK